MHRGRPTSAPGRRRAEEVQRITTAPVGQHQHQQQQIGKYLASMGIRTACFILFIVVPGPLRWVFVALAVVLPYIAVLVANAGRETVSPTTTGVTPAVHPALGAPRPQAPFVGEVYRPDEQVPAGDDRPTDAGGAGDAGAGGEEDPDGSSHARADRRSPQEQVAAGGPDGWRGAA